MIEIQDDDINVMAISVANKWLYELLNNGGGNAMGELDYKPNTPFFTSDKFARQIENAIDVLYDYKDELPNVIKALEGYRNFLRGVDPNAYASSKIYSEIRKVSNWDKLLGGDLKKVQGGKYVAENVNEVGIPTEVKDPVEKAIMTMGGFDRIEDLRHSVGYDERLTQTKNALVAKDKTALKSIWNITNSDVDKFFGTLMKNYRPDLPESSCGDAVNESYKGSMLPMFEEFQSNIRSVDEGKAEYQVTFYDKDPRVSKLTAKIVHDETVTANSPEQAVRDASQSFEMSRRSDWDKWSQGVDIIAIVTSGNKKWISTNPANNDPKVVSENVNEAFTDDEKALLDDKGFDVVSDGKALSDTTWIVKMGDNKFEISAGDNSKPKYVGKLVDAFEMVSEKSDDYKDLMSEFNNMLSKNKSVEQLSKHYNRPVADVVKELQPRISVFRKSDKSIKEISIDFTDTNSKINVKLVWVIK